MRQPEDLLPPHAYLHGEKLCQWKQKSPVILNDTSSAGLACRMERSESGIARLQRIKTELLRDKGIELRKYQKKVS